MDTCILLIVNWKPVENHSKRPIGSLIIVLLGMSTLSLCAIYRLAVAPIKPPTAPELSSGVIKGLKEKGWKVGDSVGARSLHQATSSKGIVLSGSSTNAQGNSLEMMLVPVRMRGFSLLETKDIRSYGTSEKQLYGKTLTIDDDQLELAEDRKGRNHVSTCVTRNGVASNKALTLRDAIKTERISAGRRVEILLGLKPPRDWTCLFVQISSKASNKDILEAWTAIRPVIKSKWFKDEKLRSWLAIDTELWQQFLAAPSGFVDSP